MTNDTGKKRVKKLVGQKIDGRLFEADNYPGQNFLTPKFFNPVP